MGERVEGEGCSSVFLLVLTGGYVEGANIAASTCCVERSAACFLILSSPGRERGHMINPVASAVRFTPNVRTQALLVSLPVLQREE